MGIPRLFDTELNTHHSLVSYYLRPKNLPDPGDVQSTLSVIPAGKRGFKPREHSPSVMVTIVASFKSVLEVPSSVRPQPATSISSPGVSTVRNWHQFFYEAAYLESVQGGSASKWVWLCGLKWLWWAVWGGTRRIRPRFVSEHSRGGSGCCFHPWWSGFGRNCTSNWWRRSIREMRWPATLRSCSERQSLASAHWSAWNRTLTDLLMLREMNSFVRWHSLEWVSQGKFSRLVLKLTFQARFFLHWTWLIFDKREAIFCSHVLFGLVSSILRLVEWSSTSMSYLGMRQILVVV